MKIISVVSGNLFRLDGCAGVLMMPGRYKTACGAENKGREGELI